jgi:hypothetical protein
LTTTSAAAGASGREGLAENTIFIFMTDNGPTTQRFTAGLRDQKASVYEGGIRAPFFLRWPGRLQPKKVSTIAAHIDVAPTLLEATGTAKPSTVHFDGLSLMPLFERGDDEEWPKRNIYIQSHRGNAPESGRAAAVIRQKRQARAAAQLQPAGAQGRPLGVLQPRGRSGRDAVDLVDEREYELVRINLLRDYQIWLREVSATRGYQPQRIWLGSEHENPVVLTRQDWRDKAGTGDWGPDAYGVWPVDCRSDGIYDVTVTIQAGGSRRSRGNQIRAGRGAARIRGGRGKGGAQRPAIRAQYRHARRAVGVRGPGKRRLDG